MLDRLRALYAAIRAAIILAVAAVREDWEEPCGRCASGVGWYDATHPPRPTSWSGPARSRPAPPPQRP